MRVSIVGTGYVGLVTGVCLAEKGHEVICIDVDRDKIDKIGRGISPIYERGLEDLLRKNIGRRLHATTNLREAVIDTEITLITVNTPFEGSEIDLTHIGEAAFQIGHALRGKQGYHLVAVKSTVVPGTTDEVVRPILEVASGKRAGPDFGVGVNPEFLTEGEAIDDFMVPDRLILGGMDDRSIGVLASLYTPFDGIDQLRTNNRTAEMIKCASNAFLATAISFSNEIGNLCSALGDVDVVDVMRGIHLSKYLSPQTADKGRIVAPITAFLWAGCGFGGSCLPKDVKALIAHANKVGRPMPLLDAVMRVNERQLREILSRLRKHFPSLQGVRVAVLGLAFRPDTDDMRGSPAIPVVNELLAQGADVMAYDPVANHEAARLFRGSQVTLCHDLEHAIRNAQAIILITRWDEFKRIPELLGRLESQPLFIDGRRMLDKAMVARYEGIGL